MAVGVTLDSRVPCLHRIGALLSQHARAPLFVQSAFEAQNQPIFV